MNRESDRVAQATQEDLSSSCKTQVVGRRPIGSRILFVTNAGGFGGTEKHLLDLIKRIHASGGKSLILQLGTHAYTEHVGEDELLRIDIPVEKIRNSLWLLVQLFRKIRPDVIVFINSWVRSFPWYSSFAAFLAGVPKRFSIQHSIAQPLPEVEGRSMRNVLRRLVGGRRRTRLTSSVSALFSNATICVCDAVRDRLVTDYRFPSKKTITICNGVSVSEFAPSDSNRASVRTRLGLGSEEFLLVCVTRLSKEKGIDLLLMAMARVLRQGLCCKCIIVGDGPMKESLSDQAEALGLNGRVLFEGFQKDVRPFLQTADAFVLTSDLEGLPFSVLEAMACGLPCVVTNVGGNAEAVQHMVHGLVVAPGSVDEAADAISYLATHPQERSKMSRMARARVREAFDIEVRMADIERLILD